MRPPTDVTKRKPYFSHKPLVNGAQRNIIANAMEPTHAKTKGLTFQYRYIQSCFKSHFIVFISYVYPAVSPVCPKTGKLGKFKDNQKNTRD